jgi:hypothetical protein
MREERGGTKFLERCNLAAATSISNFRARLKIGASSHPERGGEIARRASRFESFVWKIPPKRLKYFCENFSDIPRKNFGAQNPAQRAEDAASSARDAENPAPEKFSEAMRKFLAKIFESFGWNIS